MQLFTLKRIMSTNRVTQGVLCSENRALCVTLENPWLGNARNMSSIPEGRYHVQPFSGAKYKNVWQVMDVPGRSYILLHAGNSTADTDGCILVGRAFHGERILSSRNALTMLRQVLPDQFLLDIVS